MSQAILLRKFRGELAALIRGQGFFTGSFASRSVPLGSIAFALVLMLMPVLLLLGAVAAFVAPDTAVASADLSFGVVALAGTVSNALVEKRQQFATKQKELGEVFELAKDGSVYDTSRKTVLDKLGAKDSTEALEKIRSRTNELNILSEELAQAELKESHDFIDDLGRQRSQPARTTGQHPPAELKTRSFGELVAKSAEYQAYMKAGAKPGQHATVDVEIDLKTLMQVAVNGFPPESVRTGLVVDAVTRPIQVLDLIPTRPITQAVDKYMEETTRTHSAAETSEGAAFPESAFVFTERTQAVEKIADSIPVTDEQLEDEAQVSSIIDQRLRFGLRQRLDLQVLVGNGTSPNLSGILDRATSTQAKGSDPVFDAVFKALTKVRFTGRAIPNALVFHPNDWQDVRLTRTADGQYIMGNPATPGPMALFGLPVALSDALTENTGLAGDFANFCYIGERRGIQVLVGYVGDQFKEGKRTIRADLRACFTVTRPTAFCTITGI